MSLAGPLTRPLCGPLTTPLTRRGAPPFSAIRATISGADILGPDGNPLVLYGVNQSTWGENYAGDGANIVARGATVVRQVGVRWWGDSYGAGVDAYSSNPAHSYLDPAHRAQALADVDDAIAAGLWVVFAFDSDNGAGNRGLGIAEPNFIEATAEGIAKLAEWKIMCQSLTTDLLTRDRILFIEPLAEPLPNGSDSSYAAPLRDLYRDLMENIRVVDPRTPFLIGPRDSYGLNFLDEVILVERDDYAVTSDTLTNKVSGEGTIAGNVETSATFRSVNSIPVFQQQVGRETSDDIGDVNDDAIADTVDNIGLTAMNGALSLHVAYGLPFTWWQWHQNTGNPLTYALWYKTVYPGSGADNWTPKPLELAAFEYHMRLTWQAVQTAAHAAVTAITGAAFEVKDDLSNVFQDSAGTVPVTTVGQPIGRINAVVGSGVFSQGTAGLRPTLGQGQNGYSVVFSAAAGSYLALDTTFFADGDDAMVVVSGRPTASAASRVMFHCGNSSSNVRNPYLAVIATDTVTASWRADDTTNHACDSVTTCDGRAIVAVAHRVDDDKKLNLNGVQEDATDPDPVGSIASITRTRWGASSTGSNGFDGPSYGCVIAKTATAEQVRSIARWEAFKACAPFRGAIPSEAEFDDTWGGLGLLGANTAPNEDFYSGWPFRNLARQVRAFCPNSDDGGYGYSNVTLQTSGSDKGYPVDGSTFTCVFAANILDGHAGTIDWSCKGNNTPTNAAGGTLVVTGYNAGTNRTTGTLTIAGAVDENIALKWTNVTGFGALEVMQDGYNVGDTVVFTTAAVAHYANFPILRAMDWLHTNAVPTEEDWADSTASKYDYIGSYQHSLIGFLDLCTAAGTDEPWVNIPARASADYKLQFLTTLFANIGATVKPTVEITNEPWNYSFDGYWYLLADAMAEVDGWIGYDGAHSAKLPNKIVSVSRVGNEVTITTNQAHGWGVGKSFYDHSDSTNAITWGLRTTKAGTTGATIRFDHPSSGTTTGDVGTGWLDGFIYGDPTHDLAAPLATFGRSTTYPDTQALKSRWIYEIGHDLYSQAQVLGVDDRLRIAIGHQLEGGLYYAEYGLAYAREKWGLDWLYANGGGLYPAYYMRPSEAVQDDIDTEAEVFTALEDSRVIIAGQLMQCMTALKSWGQDIVRFYECGPHNDMKRSADIAVAVRAAHLDDDMRVLIKAQLQDARNRGVDGPMMYFHAGATPTFGGISFGSSNNNTWALIEGTFADTQPKLQAMTELLAATATVTEIPGVNTGTILAVDANRYHDDGESVVFGQLATAADWKAQPRGWMIYVSAANVGDVVLELDAATESNAGTDMVTLYVNGNVQGATVALPFIADLSAAKATEALQRTVALGEGFHLVTAQYSSATRAARCAIYRLRTDL